MLRCILQGFRQEGVSGKYFSYFSQKTCCGHSLEVPHSGTSNGYDNMVFGKNKKTITLLDWFFKSLSFKIVMSRQAGGREGWWVLEVVSGLHLG